MIFGFGSESLKKIPLIVISSSSPPSQELRTSCIWNKNGYSPELCVSRDWDIKKKSQFFNTNDNMKRIVKKDLHYVILCFVRYWRKKEVWMYSENTCIGCLDLGGGGGGKLLKSKRKIVLLHKLILHLRIIKGRGQLFRRVKTCNC